MAKTESTAVNQLIDLVQNQRSKPISDPSEDLFAAPKATRVNPPRVTTTIPPMRGAGEVAPLPRTRSAGGTSQHKVPNIPPPPVRMLTAPPSRGQTIPPITPSHARSSVPAIPPAGLPAPIRNTSSAPVISPVRSPSDPMLARPSAKPTLPMPKGTRPPASAPVVAPFEPARGGIDADANPFVAVPLGYPLVQRVPDPSRIDLTGDAVSAENWFEHSRVLERLEEEAYVGTAPIRRHPRAETATLVKKMVVPTVALVIVGIMIGGFIAFNGEGGKKHAAKLAAVAHVDAPKAEATKPLPLAANETLPQPSGESPNAATATAGGAQPEPPAKVAPLAPSEQAAKPVETAKPPAVAAVAKPEPIAPAVREVQTTRGVVKLADVRIDSKPSGATVMLVDNGKTSFLGTTPLATSLDPSRGYDVIFTLQGKPTQMAHLDPTKNPHLELVLGKTATTAQATPAPVVKAPALVPAPAPAHHHQAVASKASSPPPSTTLADPGFDTPAPKKAEATKVEPKKAEATKVEARTTEPAVVGANKSPVAAGSGTLMVSSKPPCEILVDGKATGLSTPQRAISLAAGTHKITLVNSAAGINKTVAVSISADQTTKLVKDLIGP